MNAHKCNLVLAGCPKCGTSSLHIYLDMHPNIVMSDVKEPHYFSVENMWVRGPRYHNALFRPGKKKDIAYYGESSTTYGISDIALRRVKEALVEPKIIFIVRDPVERAISNYRWLYSLGLENRPILEALEIDRLGFDPNQLLVGNYTGYLQTGVYSNYIPKWQEVFGEGNVLILFTDELSKNPKGVLHHCFDFLKLQSLEAFPQINTNQTQDSFRVMNRRIGSVMSKIAPKFIKEVAKRIPMMNTFWRVAAQYTLRVEPPIVATKDRDKIATLLENEVVYYRNLKANHSLDKIAKML